MEIVLWGVRGSIPNPSPQNQFYGANTSCVEVRPAQGLQLIFDAGTGIRSLGRVLPDEGECHIFITHGHSDHLQGLSFFAPFFKPGWKIHLYVPEYLEDLTDKVFDGVSFPLKLADLPAEVHVYQVKIGVDVAFVSPEASVRVEALAVNHPGGGVAYRVTTGADEDATTFLYSGDHEITDDPQVLEETAAMLKGVDLALVDAAYTKHDMRVGWGHSTWEDWMPLAEAAGVSALIFSHHTPGRTDAELDALQEAFAARSRSEANASATQGVVAREGMRFYLPAPVEMEYKTSDWLQSFLNTLAEYKEETALLDSILRKTREIASADAGSIYLVESGELVFAYSQNDTLFPGNDSNKSMYVNMRLPITEGSIAGYVAATGKTLNIADMYALPEDVPYSFNASFDKKSGYYTKSTLTVPLGNSEGHVLGVLQLINSKAPRSGEVIPFSEGVVDSVQILAREASAFLEISSQVYQSVARLLRIAMLHDPSETGPHAERVGAIAAETYQCWAVKKGLPLEQIRSFKGQLRLAAMVHDIGKVGISNAILKKPGKLTDEEFDIMRTHTVLGAELFTVDSRDIAEMAHEISLHHHQKWNGKGYPAVNGVTPAGEDIPLSARITAVADVFDALVSPRCYKTPWTFEKATGLLREEAGQHFDPELVECFLEILDTIALIYERYPDSDSGAQEQPASA